MKTIVIGHKNPDMDSICSALAYADLKKRLGWSNVVAGRCGHTNERIDFVLNKFRFEPPVFYSDISPKVEDVMEHDVVFADENASVYQAVNSIEQKHLRGLPVLDSERRCLGLLSSFQISHYLFPHREEAMPSRIVPGSLRDMLDSFSGKVLVGIATQNEQEYLLMVAAMSADSFRHRLKSYTGRHIVLIVGDREDIQEIAIEEKVAAIIVTGDFTVSNTIISLAEKKGVVLISSPGDTASTLLFARGGIRVSRMLDRKFMSFYPETLLRRAREQATSNSAFVFPVVDHEDRVVGILSKSDFLKPVLRQIILVDHNEMSQAVDGIESLPIIEVIDHHRLGSFQTDLPILFWNSPVGSTCTLVAQSFRNNQIPIPPDVGGLLMAGIIADTLNLTSPTATQVDRDILAELAAIVQVSPAELADQIFSVGSPLRSLSAENVVHTDSKEYLENGHRFSVAQIEELSLSLLDEKKAGLLEALSQSRNARGLLFASLLVTDINTQQSILLVCGESSLLSTIDFPQIDDQAWRLDDIVSRKKQLLPYLLQCLGRMELAEK